MLIKIDFNLIYSTLTYLWDTESVLVSFIRHESTIFLFIALILETLLLFKDFKEEVEEGESVKTFYIDKAPQNVLDA